MSQALLVKQGNPKNLHSYEDAARNPNARLGVVVGAIESDYAASLKVPPDRTIVFPDAVSALAGVQAGRADAYAATALTVNDLMGKAGKDSGLEKAEPFTDPVIDGRACALWRLCLPQGRPGLRRRVQRRAGQVPGHRGAQETGRALRLHGRGAAGHDGGQAVRGPVRVAP